MRSAASAHDDITDDNVCNTLTAHGLLHRIAFAGLRTQCRFYTVPRLADRTREDGCGDAGVAQDERSEPDGVCIPMPTLGEPTFSPTSPDRRPMVQSISRADRRHHVSA
jgi:hypothetical protein